MRTLLVGLGALSLVFIAAHGPAFAEDSLPLRAGRVSLAQGAASYRPAGAEWSDAVTNLPVATGTALRTAGSGSAELGFGDTAVTLAGGSEVDVARLEPHVVQIALPHGRIGIAVRSLGDGGMMEIDLPRGAVWLLEPGQYDIDAGAGNGPVRVAVFDGRARFVGGGNDGTVASGSTARLGGTGAIASTLETASADAFDTAWQGRVSDDDTQAARLHLSPELAGLTTLDRSGNWRAVDPYGAVWFPDGVAADWAPYRDGAWRWIPPWGWTWIDHASWGFAPSHYGRWARIDDRWGWVPGKPIPDPAYLPAAVAFLGTPGVGLSYADAFSPAIAWLPLAPGEIYWPGFTGDAALIRRLNAPDIGDLWVLHHADNGGPPTEIVTGEYRNRRFASVVPRAAFMAGQPVVPALVAIPETRLDVAPVIAQTVPFPPAPAPRAVATAQSRGLALVAAARAALPVVAAAPSRGLALIAAARAALPALAAAASSRLRVVGHLVHATRAAASAHAAVLRQAPHGGSRNRIPAKVVKAQHGDGHRHLAALHGRAR